jgi:hypothetical protein
MRRHLEQNRIRVLDFELPTTLFTLYVRDPSPRCMNFEAHGSVYQLIHSDMSSNPLTSLERVKVPDSIHLLWVSISFSVDIADTDSC